MFKRIIAISLVLFAGACSGKISNFHSYLPQELPKTNFMPSPEMAEGQSPKVVVFELDDGDNETAKQANLGESITIALENVITQNRLAKLVDRKAAKKLKEEIALIEMNKTGSYKGPEIADYAISGAIGNAGFTKIYSSGMVLPSAAGGFTRLPPSFKYTSDISGNVKIYELPSMAVIENIEFSGRKTKKEQVQTDNNISIGGIIEFGGQKVEGLTRDDGLVRNAGIEAIDNISFILKNFFAKKGFIAEKRVLKNKAIFKISVGSSDGLKAGDKFEIIGQYENFNALTGKTEVERRVIASGKVSHRVDPKSAWVLIDDKDSINLIRLGDLVRFKYKRSFWNKAEKFVDNL